MNYIFEYGLWETDFLLQEILPKGNVKFIRKEFLENIEEYCDVFVFACRLHKFENIQKTIQKIKPKIIIMTSDEFYQENNNIYNQLGNECELFLRQYHHSRNIYTSNTIHIPLGYTNNCKVFNESKRLNWSWFGDLKNDREEMLNEFKKINSYLIGNSVSKLVMCKSYSQSIFVPCGRGNSSLDCYRIYEASMNGAIPIVVGSKEEIECTFKYEENPSWIFAETWKDAFQKCISMLDCDVNNAPVLDWWKNRIKKIKSKILEVL